MRVRLLGKARDLQRQLVLVGPEPRQLGEGLAGPQHVAGRQRALPVRVPPRFEPHQARRARREGAARRRRRRCRDRWSPGWRRRRCRCRPSGPLAPQAPCAARRRCRRAPHRPGCCRRRPASGSTPRGAGRNFFEPPADHDGTLRPHGGPRTPRSGRHAAAQDARLRLDDGDLGAQRRRDAASSRPMKPPPMMAIRGRPGSDGRGCAAHRRGAQIWTTRRHLGRNRQPARHGPWPAAASHRRAPAASRRTRLRRTVDRSHGARPE